MRQRTNYANLLFELNRKTEADEHYKLAIAANPNFAKVHSNYANLLFELNRKTEAEEHYKLAITANPNDSTVHYNYAILLKELNRKTEAEEHYKLAIAANPNLAEAHTSYAILLSELRRKTEEEEHYKLAIATNPNYATAHINYANLLKELNRKKEAEEHYKLAIATNPNYATAHINYANLLFELNRKTEAEEHYKLAIAANPNDAAAHYNYAILLKELNQKTEAEEHYKLAIAANPNLAEAHASYAILLSELNRKTEAEEHYKLLIAANPNYATGHSNYAILLSELNRKKEAEKHIKLAIAANPNSIEAHGAYGLLLIDIDERVKAWEETEIASGLFEKALRFSESHLAKAWFYEKYSKKYLENNKYSESSEDVFVAGQEYLKAAETAIEGSKEKSAFELRGNELIAKSYIRKEHKNPLELISNLKMASEYYKKASVCQVGGREEVCAACRKVINVFSEVLNSLDDIINDKVPLINKSQWKNDLGTSLIVYEKKKSEKGIKLIETLNAFIKCVAELYDYKESKSIVQKKRLKDCYTKLIEVSANIEGGLKNITDPATDIIENYARKKGYPISDDSSIEKSKSPLEFLDKGFIKYLIIILTVIAAFIAILQFFQLDKQALEFIKSISFNGSSP
jgi:tetratricopeptide (TPR) repeat protein